MPIEPARLELRFDSGLEHVSEAGAPPPTIDLRPGGLLRQESALGNRLEELYGAMKLDGVLYDSVKPRTTRTTRTGKISLSGTLSSILSTLAAMEREGSLPAEDVSALSGVIREDIFNQELLAACRRALVSG